jgi:hypothetical protein
MFWQDPSSVVISRFNSMRNRTANIQRSIRLSKRSYSRDAEKRISNVSEVGFRGEAVFKNRHCLDTPITSGNPSGYCTVDSTRSVVFCNRFCDRTTQSCLRFLSTARIRVVGCCQIRWSYRRGGRRRKVEYEAVLYERSPEVILGVTATPRNIPSGSVEINGGVSDKSLNGYRNENLASQGRRLVRSRTFHVKDFSFRKEVTATTLSNFRQQTSISLGFGCDHGPNW